jgi:hypothetical protein
MPARLPELCLGQHLGGLAASCFGKNDNTLFLEEFLPTDKPIVKPQQRKDVWVVAVFFTPF